MFREVRFVVCILLASILSGCDNEGRRSILSSHCRNALTAFTSAVKSSRQLLW